VHSSELTFDSSTAPVSSDRHVDTAWLSRVSNVAHALDSAWGVPGTNLRLGLDSVLGLIPGAGDLVAMGLSGYLLWEAYRHGASRGTLMRMASNIAIDTGIGSIPLLGDLFDVFWKSNRRNMRLLEREFQAHRPRLRR